MKRAICKIAAVVLLFGLVQGGSPTFAGNFSSSAITSEVCNILSDAAEKESKRIGIHISFSIVDAAGMPLYFKRMGDALPISVQLVPNKAYTAAKLRTATENITKEVEPGGSLFGINSVANRIVVIAGGFPLYVEGKCVGAIGVGGGTAKEDSMIGKHVVKVFEDSVRH